VARKTYETLFLLDSNRYAKDPNGTSATVNTLIEQAGGDILASRLWNEQKLAYAVDGHHKGTYWLAYYNLESTQLVGLARTFQLNESILREMTIRLDPRLVEPMVALAKGERQPVAAAPVAAAVPVGAGGDEDAGSEIEE
jgi:small subunit ribosomal protein S6